jgi:hypothetical protein
MASAIHMLRQLLLRREWFECFASRSLAAALRAAVQAS